MPVGGMPNEPSRSSDSLPAVCSDKDWDNSPAGLARKQCRGLYELWDKRDSKYEDIRLQFARNRYRTRQYYEGQILLAQRKYEQGMGCCMLKLFFGRLLRRELKSICEKEQNAMNVLLKGETIERVAVTNKFADWEENYIIQCRKECARRYPATPFWYDEQEELSTSGDYEGSSVSAQSFA
ncbi:uncharacterized protein GLRG_07016 [Colletotrichum graminicola M1.001]|uniref:Uncharacterized protein n=1 Tax=Colletotrichum graminicola (strain M1.001 / M2 / FGSC 10212) TaxID=645133 RepID=E3QLY4_COLGM|nr:uncharacterized protein GLRG_07016 [Colletotrichum graminicola M1.001]EFQ31872.1 hypothetical protein GLRG_07016 [Colletotrichum graminicola M1.001]